MSRLRVRLAVPVVVALCAWLAPVDAAADSHQAGKATSPPATGARGSSGGSAPPVSVTVTETVTVTDAPRALPPVTITINESVGISDKPGGAPPPKSEPPAKTQ